MLIIGPDNHLQPHLGVSHGRQGVVDAGGGGGHGQQGRDGQHHPGRGRLVVQPEGHPGHADRHEGGDVDCEDVVRELKCEQCSNIEKYFSSSNRKKKKMFDVDVNIFFDGQGWSSDVLNSLIQKVKFMNR